jgi:hypothetical protein
LFQIVSETAQQKKFKKKFMHGLKNRLDKGFAKFGREGSVWRWEFYWNEGKSGKQHGYDKGYLQQNADIFERLKIRFFNGVLLNAGYYKKAHLFILFLCGKTTKEDIPILELHIRSDYKLKHEFTTQAKEIFSEGCLQYISETITQIELQIQSKEQGSINIMQLIEQANEKYSKQMKQDEQAQAQTFWEKLLIACFPKDVRPSLATIKARADKENKLFFLYCTEKQKEFLEANLEAWADYFLSKAKAYQVNYILPQHSD